MIRNAHFDEGINLACVLDFKCANVNLKLSYSTLLCTILLRASLLQIGRSQIKNAQQVQTHFNPKTGYSTSCDKFPFTYALSCVLFLFNDSKDVRLPVQLQRAMAAEAEAAREARAKVLFLPKSNGGLRRRPIIRLRMLGRGRPFRTP